jgi:hypothetical protein
MLELIDHFTVFMKVWPKAANLPYIATKGVSDYLIAVAI